MSLLTLVVIALLLGGVVVSVAPKIPGGVALTVAGVYLHWFGTGFSEPHSMVVILLTMIGIFILLSNLVGPVIRKKIGDTPAITTTIGGLVGAVGSFIWGTPGFIVGMFLTVFVLEYLRRGDVVESVVSSIVTVLATFSLKPVKIIVSVTTLAVMLFVILL